MERICKRFFVTSGNLSIDSCPVVFSGTVLCFLQPVFFTSQALFSDIGRV